MNRTNKLNLTTLEGRAVPSATWLAALAGEPVAGHVRVFDGAKLAADANPTAHSSGGAAGGVVSEGQGYGYR